MHVCVCMHACMHVCVCMCLCLGSGGGGGKSDMSHKQDLSQGQDSSPDSALPIT